jgi:NADH:ubiquinone oxidoreductase subunit 2 (subunit N)
MTALWFILLLFGAAIDAGHTWLAVALRGILNSVFSLAVYLRVIVPKYRPAREGSVAVRPVVLVWSVALLVTVGIGIGAQMVVGRLS